jgi:hypothetical protein
MALNQPVPSVSNAIAWILVLREDPSALRIHQTEWKDIPRPSSTSALLALHFLPEQHRYYVYWLASGCLPLCNQTEMS